jgi:hypothetical protein
MNIMTVLHTVNFLARLFSDYVRGIGLFTCTFVSVYIVMLSISEHVRRMVGW